MIALFISIKDARLCLSSAHMLFILRRVKIPIVVHNVIHSSDVEIIKQTGEKKKEGSGEFILLCLFTVGKK